MKSAALLLGACQRNEEGSLVEGGGEDGVDFALAGGGVKAVEPSKRVEGRSKLMPRRRESHCWVTASPEYK